MLTLYPLLAPRVFVPRRFVSLQRIETNMEKVSTQFVHLAHPPSSYIAQVCAIVTLREWLVRFEPGVPYEIRYRLIEGNVLFPDHALVVNRMVIICYDAALLAAHQQLSIPHCLFTSSIYPRHPTLLVFHPSTLCYLDATVPFSIRRQF